MKNNYRKSSKGSALFMVVCTMAIMLVVIMTAMSMISITYTKSLQDYTASQSYVTARNVLDTYIAAMKDTGPAAQLSETERKALFKDFSTWYLASPEPAVGTTKDFTVSEIPDGMATSGVTAVTVTEEYLGKVAAGPAKGNPMVTVKITVTVTSGEGDTEQTRTLASVVTCESILEPNPPSSFPNAVSANGAVTSGAGAGVIGGASSRTGDIELSDLNANPITASMRANGDLKLVNSSDAPSGILGEGMQISVGGVFGADNTVKLKSTADPANNANPFIYCDQFYWNSTSIFEGPIDVIAVNGSSGPYKGDNITVEGNIYSGDDFVFGGNNIKLNGNIYCWGDLSLSWGSIDWGGSAGTIYVPSGCTAFGKAPGEIANVVELDTAAWPVSCLSDDQIANFYNGETDKNLTLEVNLPGRTYVVDTEASTAEGYCTIKPDGTIEDPVEARDFAANALGMDWDTAYASATPMASDTSVPVSSGALLKFDGGTYQNVEIRATGGGDVYILQSGDVTLNNVRVITDEFDAQVAGGELECNKLGASTDFTHVYWVVDSDADSELYIAEIDGKSSFLNCYIYSVGAGIVSVSDGHSPCYATVDVQENNGWDYKQTPPVYNAANETAVIPSVGCAVVGGITGQDVKIGTLGCIVFIPLDSGIGGTPPTSEDPKDYVINTMNKYYFK